MMSTLQCYIIVIVLWWEERLQLMYCNHSDCYSWTCSRHPLNIIRDTFIEHIILLHPTKREGGSLSFSHLPNP